MTPDPRPDDAPAPDVSADDPPQAASLFLEDEAPDEALETDIAAFDRVQTRVEDIEEHEIETEYEREYNKRYVEEHGDHRGHGPTAPEAG